MSGFHEKALLVVDDSGDDIELLKRAFIRAGGVNPIVALKDGEEAIEYLVRCIESGQADRQPLPIAILTDLKMARGDGFQLLKWIRGQPVLDQVLTVVITNSSMESDVQRAFTLGANFFLTKPADFADFVVFATNLLAWLRLNRFPEEPEQKRKWSLLHGRKQVGVDQVQFRS